MDGRRHYVGVIENPRLCFTVLPRFGPAWRVTQRRTLGWKKAVDAYSKSMEKTPSHVSYQTLIRENDHLVKAAFSCVAVRVLLSLNQEAKCGRVGTDQSSEHPR